ncbi:MAG TPA: LysR family transcriptional regulator [Candidatus Paceibacterota bacterium]|nr:LysR family transcriptional regulator [Candidatus Paceibacterota bacterium]
MELRLLKVFSAIAEGGSLVAAANKLQLTPSAISHSLKALETDLGCRLFERVGKRMVLNQAGDQLLLAIREPLNALESAAEGIKRLGQWGQSRLRIGASAAACQHVLPSVIRELKKTHPTLELHVESGNTSEVLDLIRETTVDLALCIAPETTPGLDVRPVFRDELLFVFAPSHPWAAAKTITNEEISQQQFIAFQRASFTTRLFSDHLRHMEIVPKILMEVDSIGAIIEMVKFNLGIAVLAPWTIEQELVRGSLKARPLGPKPLRRQWSVVSLAVRPKTYVEETFCRLCRNHATGMRLDARDLTGLRK